MSALVCHGAVARDATDHVPETPGGVERAATASADAAVAPAPYQWHLPRGFPMPAVPSDNPMTAEKVTLGRRLFFEPRLSVTGHYSCASCHEPERAFTDGRALAVGATGQPLSRSAMTLINAAYNVSFGWTKREVVSLEQQMLEPLLNEHPVELGLAGREAAVCNMLAEDPDYRAAFTQAFPGGASIDGAGGSTNAGRADRGLRTGGATATDDHGDRVDAVADRHRPRTANLADTEATARPTLGAGDAPRANVAADASAAGPVTFDNLVKAIAAFERTLIAGDSPFDHYVFQGEHEALSAQQKRGMELFYSPRAGCGSCHSGFNFNGNWRDSQGATGESAFANNGVGDQPMRVPTLRNIVLTAPYMHDGRFETLEAVLDHYAQVAKQTSSDPKLRTFDLSPNDRADLIAFLHALTDSQFSGR